MIDGQTEPGSNYIPDVKKDLAVHPSCALVGVEHAEDFPVGNNRRFLLDSRILASPAEVFLECSGVTFLEELVGVERGRQWIL